MVEVVRPEVAELRAKLAEARGEIDRLECAIRARDDEIEVIVREGRAQAVVLRQRIGRLRRQIRKHVVKREPHGRDVEVADGGSDECIRPSDACDGEVENEEVRLVREDYERQLAGLREEQARELTAIVQDGELRRMEEMDGIRTQRGEEIARLVAGHKARVAELRGFYGRLADEHAAVVRGCAEEWRALEEESKALEEQRAADAMVVPKLREKLEDARVRHAEVASVHGKCVREREEAVEVQASLEALEARCSLLESHVAQQKRRYGAVEQERDDLISRFESVMRAVRARTEVRAAVLEERVEAMQGGLQWKEEARARGGAEGREQASAAADGLLEGDDGFVRGLEDALVRATRAHNEMVAHYVSRLVQAGVPREELVFMPMG